MHYIDLVAILAVFQFFFFGMLTGRVREKSGLKAPAMTGNEDFERIYRVQMNTLEMIVIFLPALFLAAKYWPQMVVGGIGVVYLIGRFVYWRAYVTEPSKRTIGFILTAFPTLILIILTVVGIIMALVNGA